MEWHDFSIASPYVPVTTTLLAFACDHAPENIDAEITARTCEGFVFSVDRGVLSY